MKVDQKGIGKKLNTLIHIACWGILLHLIFNFVGLYHSFHDLFIIGKPMIDEAFLLIPLMVGLFYANSLILVPFFLSKKKVLFYIIGTTSTYFLFLLVGNLLYLFLVEQGYKFRINEGDVSDTLIFSGILVVGISTSVGLSKILQENTLLKKRAEEERKKAELKYLSAQVNPHFLFNTLNAIYSLATQEDAPKTTEAVLKLSEILRYPIKEGEQSLNPIAKEIKFIEDYIELQKIRLGSDYPIQFDVKGELTDKKIAPLLFIPLVENAFKYGVSRQNPSKISVNFNLLDDSIILTVKNSKNNKADVPSSNLGIQNLKERLEIIYPEKFELNIDEKEDYFNVMLKVFDL